MVAQNVERPGLSVRDSTFVASGVVTNAKIASQRQFTFATRGQLDGLIIDDPNVAKAVGSSASFQGDGNWQAGQPIVLDQLKLLSHALDLSTSGKLTGLTYTGVTQLALKELAAFSGLAQRPLEGQADLQADGEVDFLVGGFNINLDGTARKISLASDALDGLLKSNVLLSGNVQRNQNGLEFERLRLGNAQFHTALNGSYATKTSNLEATVKIHDLVALSDQAQGLLAVNLSTTGEDEIHNIKVTTQLPYFCCH